MTKIFTKNNSDFYDDYAHHPTEIKSTLDSVKMFSKTEKSFPSLNHIATLEFYLLKMSLPNLLQNLT